MFRPNFGPGQCFITDIWKHQNVWIHAPCSDNQPKSFFLAHSDWNQISLLQCEQPQSRLNGILSRTDWHYFQVVFSWHLDRCVSVWTVPNTPMGFDCGIHYFTHSSTRHFLSPVRLDGASQRGQNGRMMTALLTRLSLAVLQLPQIFQVQKSILKPT